MSLKKTVILIIYYIFLFLTDISILIITKMYHTIFMTISIFYTSKSKYFFYLIINSYVLLLTHHNFVIELIFLTYQHF